MTFPERLVEGYTAFLGSRLRERVSHPARARIGDAAHRVDALERLLGGQQHALAGEEPRLA